MADLHTTQVLEAMGPDKAAAKKSRTIVGVAVGVFGLLAALTSFLLMLRLVWTGAAIDKWSVIFVALPFGGGLFMAVLGAHVASGELVKAGLKDIGAAVRSVWKRNGGGA